MDPVADAALIRVRRSLDDLRSAVRGAPALGLNWRPCNGANSIASQVAHVLRSVDFLLSSAAGGSRDLRAYLGRREDAFHFGADANALLEMLDEFEANLAGLLRSVEAGRFAETLDWPEWQSPTVAWCLLGVVEHLREHVGAAALTRQLWDAGPGRETQTLAR